MLATLLAAARDPLWQAVGAVLALLTLLIAARTARRREPRDLVFDLLSTTPLMTTTERFEGKLHLTFDNAPFNDAHLTLIRLANSGTLPITAADYDQPLRFTPTPPTTLLTADFSDASPPDLIRTLRESKLTPRIDRQSVSLAPFLLNQNDYITLKLLSAGRIDHISATGRLVGGRVRQRPSPSKWFPNRRQTVYRALSFATILIIGAAASFFLNSNASTFAKLLTPHAELASGYVMNASVSGGDTGRTVTADLDDEVLIEAHVTNISPNTVKNVRAQLVLTNNKANKLEAYIIISADNAPTVVDYITVVTGDSMPRYLIYTKGQSYFNILRCPGHRCKLSDEVAGLGVRLGDLSPGEKGDLFLHSSIASKQ